MVCIPRGLAPFLPKEYSGLDSHSPFIKSGAFNSKKESRRKTLP